MNTRLELWRVLCTLAACGLAHCAFAQSSTDWNTPAEVQAIDFRLESPERKVLFLDDGLAYQIALDFMMIERGEVRVEAELGEPGRFQVEVMNPRALVEVKNVRVEGTQGKAEVEARVKPLSRSDATARARQAVAKIWDPVEERLASEIANTDEAQIRSYLTRRNVDVPKGRDEAEAAAELRRVYLQERTLQQVLPDFRRALAELVERKSQWASAADKLRWQRAEDRTPLDDYQELVEYEVKDQHLRSLGLGFQSNIAEFEARLDSRFDAVYLATSGKVGDDPEQIRRMVQVLGVQDLNRLRDSLHVELRCRFYPAADPNDPNAQWFNAQRVACQARQVASIRVEGKLDPTKNDRVDWWTLEDYDEAQVILDVQTSAGFRVDRPFRTRQGVRLRVVATGEEPVTYVLGFRPRKKKDGLAVMIHESPAAADTGFPY